MPPAAVSRRFDKILNNVIIATRHVSQVENGSPPVTIKIRLLFFKNQLNLRFPLKLPARTVWLSHRGTETTAAIILISRTVPGNNSWHHLYHPAGHQGRSNEVGNAAFRQASEITIPTSQSSRL